MTTYKYYQQVVPAGFMAVVFEHEVNAHPDPFLITFGLDVDLPAFDLAALDALAAMWGDNVVEPLMSTNTALVRTTASDAGGVVLESFASHAGTVVGPFGPVSNSVIIEKRSGLSGRRNRGRIYLPVVPDADVNENGEVDADLRIAAVAAVTAFRTAAVAHAAIDQLVILHSKGWGEGDDPRDPVPADPGNAPAPTVITSFTSRPIIGTQRRRVR